MFHPLLSLPRTLFLLLLLHSRDTSTLRFPPHPIISSLALYDSCLACERIHKQPTNLSVSGYRAPGALPGPPILGTDMYDVPVYLCTACRPLSSLSPVISLPVFLLTSLVLSPPCPTTSFICHYMQTQHQHLEPCVITDRHHHPHNTHHLQTHHSQL